MSIGKSLARLQPLRCEIAIRTIKNRLIPIVYPPAGCAQGLHRAGPAGVPGCLRAELGALLSE
jgi:hypothetical protein